jgi:galactokinase
MERGVMTVDVSAVAGGGGAAVVEASCGGAAAVAELAAFFRERFAAPPRAAARAPGRVNLIGEHTDYNDGLVLPCAVDRHVLALVAPRGGTQVRVFSRELGAGSFQADALARRGDWLDYLQGVLFALGERGRPVPGFDLALASRVPVGGGLSSSAALTLAVVTALDACFGLGLGARDRARVAHRAEQGFVGVACGIMDPFASALGRRDHALRLDCRSQAVEAVALPAGRVRLLVADSGVPRELSKGAYGKRVAECRRALGVARAAGLAPAGARALRDLAPERLPELEDALDPLLARRVRHVLTENQRVEATCAALRAGDLDAAGARLRQGMRSLREDFQVSGPELDALCAAADILPGVFGSRLTGAGFGGCTLHLVAPEAAEPVAAALAEAFQRRFGRRPPIHSVCAAEGAAALPLP